MLRSPVCCIAFALFVAPVLAAGPDAAPTADCDRLAASREDPTRPKDVAGVLAKDIDAAAAIAACRKAVDSDPENPRLLYQLVRALAKAERFDEAFPLGLKAAEAGHAGAQNATGYSYDVGEGVGTDDAEALRWYRKAAEQGNARAMVSIGYMYENAEGVAEDKAEALRWYRRAAELGNAMAINNIGAMHEEGLGGLPKNPAEAAVWYRRASEKDNSLATSNLGWLYLLGLGVPQDDEQARQWLEKAQAAKDNTTAENMALAGLGLLHARGGGGLPKDEAKALAMVTEAAKRDESYGQFALGQLHEQGIGTKADPVEALKWYRLAAKQDHSLAKAAVARLEKQ